MADPFDSPKRRIARAKEHLADLERKVKAFADSKPYTRVIERDEQGVNELHKIKLTQAVPLEFEDIAFDIAGNLRAALDQAAYICAIASGKANPKRTQFPIADTAAQLETDVIGRGNCKDIPADILTLFRSFQPHQGGNEAIWALNRIANANKHRLVVPMGTAVGGIHAKKIFIKRTSGFAIPAPRWDSEKNEITYAIIGPGTEIEYDINFALYIAFGPVSGVEGKPAIRGLNEIASAVERVVLATEAEARRIGLIT